MESQNHRIKVLTVIRSKHPFLRDEDAEAERAGGAGRSWCGVCSGAAPGPAFPAGFPHRAPQHPASAGCTAGLGAQVIRIQVTFPGKTMGSRWFHGTVQPAVVDVGDTIHVASGKPTLSPSVDPCHSQSALHIGPKPWPSAVPVGSCHPRWTTTPWGPGLVCLVHCLGPTLGPQMARGAVQLVSAEIIN